MAPTDVGGYAPQSSNSHGDGGYEFMDAPSTSKNRKTQVDKSPEIAHKKRGL